MGEIYGEKLQASEVK